MVTFEPSDYSAASDPTRLFQESLSKMPFLASIDIKSFTAQDSLYQEYRGKYVYSQAVSEHEKVRTRLEAMGVRIVQDFIVSNSFVVEANKEQVATLAGMTGVIEVHTNKPFKSAVLPTPSNDEIPLQADLGRMLWSTASNKKAGRTADAPPQWNISNIGADKVWGMTGGPKSTGKGMVYAVADTGIDLNHPNIAAGYRGRKEDGGFDHNYNWWDGVRQPRSKGRRAVQVPRLASKMPCDDQGHGTHVTSIAVGQGGIGVAPLCPMDRLSQYGRRCRLHEHLPELPGILPGPPRLERQEPEA